MFRPRTSPEAIDLVAKLLEYTPEARLSAVEAMCHSFFDELRVEGARMPNGKDFPPLFNFTREGASCRLLFACASVTRSDVVFFRFSSSVVLRPSCFVLRSSLCICEMVHAPVQNSRCAPT